MRRSVGVRIDKIMGEFGGEQFNREEELVEQPVEQEAGVQQEMPEDFEDPEGKAGKWKTVKGEVEIEGQKVEVTYREKVINLPEHRQEETGIKRIRRRELLPPFPDKMFISAGEENPDAREESRRYLDYSFWRSATHKEFAPIYKFLTDGIYPSAENWVHQLRPWRGVGDKDIERHKKEGMYFQKIFPEMDKDAMPESSLTFFDRTSEGIKEWEFGRYPTLKGRIPDNQLATFNLFCRPNRMFNQNFFNPVFIFGNKNIVFDKYVNSILSNSEVMQMIDLQNKNPRQRAWVDKGLRAILQGKILSEDSEPLLTCVRHPDIKPLRWCHAECALVPTKRSLNVLLFETGEEDKQEDNEK